MRLQFFPLHFVLSAFVTVTASHAGEKSSSIPEQSPKPVETPSMDLGGQVYESRCVQCHGMEGKGDGRLSKAIKNPPPFNLTMSVVSDDYLKQIILNGGEEMGRSPSMPPWRDKLSELQVNSVIIYLHSLRHR